MAITNNWGKIYCSSHFGDEDNKQTVQNVFTDVCGGGSGGVSTGLNLLATYTGEDSLGTGVSAWQSVSLDISAYAGYTGRVVFHYQNTGSLGDVQIDTIQLSTTGGTQSRTFAIATTNMQTNSSTTAGTDYSSISFQAVGTITGNPLYTGKFARRQYTGDTPNTGTADASYSGADSYMCYFLSASVQKNGWLRYNNAYTIASGSPTLNFKLARKGTDIGTLKVYLDIQ